LDLHDNLPGKIAIIFFITKTHGILSLLIYMIYPSLEMTLKMMVPIRRRLTLPV